MIPVRFGSPGRGLAGMYHPPAGNAARAVAVLLCPPFGQEAIRSHRVYRLLAERLAQRGAAVLRFDPHGTGDSPGDDTDGDLAGWQRDVRIAHRQLRALCADERPIAWLGMRLGATVLALASSEPLAGLERLVLWAPIVEGSAYLRTLGAAHREAMTHVLGRELRSTAAVCDDPDEALGFAVSGALRAQLRAVTAATLAASVGTCRVGLLAGEDPAIDAFAQALGERAVAVAREPEREPIDWSAQEALGTAIAPPATMMALLSLLGVPA